MAWSEGACISIHDLAEISPMVGIKHVVIPNRSIDIENHAAILDAFDLDGLQGIGVAKSQEQVLSWHNRGTSNIDRSWRQGVREWNRRWLRFHRPTSYDVFGWRLSSVAPSNHDRWWLSCLETDNIRALWSYPSPFIQLQSILSSLDRVFGGIGHHLKVFFGVSDFGVYSVGGFGKTVSSGSLSLGSINKFVSLPPGAIRKINNARRKNHDGDISPFRPFTHVVLFVFGSAALLGAILCVF
jgi:hypothetical protein